MAKINSTRALASHCYRRIAHPMYDAINTEGDIPGCVNHPAKDARHVAQLATERPSVVVDPSREDWKASKLGKRLQRKLKADCISVCSDNAMTNDEVGVCTIIMTDDAEDSEQINAKC